MTPEQKIKAYFFMNSRDAADRALFDRIIHPDIVQIDAPAGIELRGKEAIWQGMNIPPEQKQGPDTFAFASDFIDYVGEGKRGVARWWFQPTGKFGFLWGRGDCIWTRQEAPKIVIAVAVEFRDGMISHLDEYWNPTPLLQQLGFEVPSPGLPS